MSKVITENKIIALVTRLYASYTTEYGTPKKPLKKVYVGKLGVDEVADTYQLLGKSYISISDEFVGSTHIKLLTEVVKHELAHVYAGVENQHNGRWEKWAKRFGCKENLY